MDYTNYRVDISRVYHPWFKTKGRPLSFYIPKVSSLNDRGEIVFRPFLNPEEYPTAWGFETEEAAWNACKEYYLSHTES